MGEFWAAVDWPGWVQALGSLAAVWLAYYVWRRDQREKKAQQERDENEQTTRFVAALRWEIVAAISLVRTFKPIVEEVLKGIEKAEAENKFQDTDLNRDMFKFTDRVAYKQVISHIGRLPTEVAELVVRFYARLTEFEQSLAMMDKQKGAYKRFKQFAPSIEFIGEITALLLRRFIHLRNHNTAAMWITADEIAQTATMCNYPIDKISDDLRNGITIQRTGT